MKITKTAIAGTENREDLRVTVRPAQQGVEIIVRSSVGALFGPQIEAAARELLAQYGIEACVLEIDDQSALDYAVRARVETAILRAIAEVDA